MSIPAARVATRWLEATQIVHEPRSPLKYNYGNVERYAIYDSSVPVDPSDKFTRDAPGLVAFLDFTTPWRLPDDFYIHYTYVRPDQRGKGYARKLMDYVYRKHSDASWIDWGKIVNPGMEKLFQERRRESNQPGYEGPHTTGKVW